MLEVEINELQVPPKPLLYPTETLVVDVNTEIELETFSSFSTVQTNSSSYWYEQSK